MTPRGVILNHVADFETTVNVMWVKYEPQAHCRETDFNFVIPETKMAHAWNIFHARWTAAASQKDQKKGPLDRIGMMGIHFIVGHGCYSGRQPGS
jgi:hypothetical protein